MAKLLRPSLNLARGRSFLNITEDLSDINVIDLFASVQQLTIKSSAIVSSTGKLLFS